ncbi:MAG: hypothetical protein WD030_08930 [Pirellulales bacterium]
MSREPQSAAPLFTQIEISTASAGEATSRGRELACEQTHLLQQMLAAQDRQNELLEELVSQMSAAQRQRNNELQQWKQANPALAERCRQAAEALAAVQAEFLGQLTEEVQDNADDLLDGEFVFNEFVDRYGPRLAHLNGVLQMLSQLSGVSEPIRD